MTKSLPLLAAAAFLLAATPAQAHVTTTVDPLSGPLVVGVPTQVTVHFSEPCFEVIPQEAQGQDTVASGLAPDAPATVAWTGQEVAFTSDLCDFTAVPFALVRATATLTLVASASAPGLTAFDLPVTSYLGNGTEPGDVVPLNVTIAYHANGTLAAAEAAGHDAHGNATAIPLTLTLDYTTNAESVLTIEAASTSGSVAAIAPADVTPPSFDSKANASRTVTTLFTPPAEWTSADLTFKAFLAPKAGGEKVPVGTATLTLANDAAGEAHDEEHGHEDAEESPAPVFAYVGLGLAALAALRRR